MSDNYKKYVSGYSEAGCKYDVPTREFFENTIPLVKCYQFENKVILKDNPTKVNEYPLNDEYELRANSNNYDLQVNGQSVKLPTDYFSDRKRYIRFKFKEIKDNKLYCWIDGNETIISFFRIKIENVTFINFDEVYKVNHNFEGVAYIEKGESAKITGATASVDGTIGTPSVDVTSGGTALERSFNFSFSGLKGEKGDKGETGGLTNITQELGSQTDYVISQKVVTDNLNLKANQADVYTKTEVDNSLNLKFDKASVLQETGISTSETISQKVITDNLNLKQDKGNYIKLNDLATASYVRLHTIDPVRTIVIIRTRLYLGTGGFVTYTLPVTMPNNIYAVVTNNSLKNDQTNVWYFQPRVWEKTTTSVTFLNQFKNNYFDCIIINIG